MSKHIRNMRAFRQPVVFDGMEFIKGNTALTPTDIDIILEFNNEIWLMAEVKHYTRRPTAGQRLLLQRLVANMTALQIPAVAFFATHAATTSDNLVIAADCMVEFYTVDGQDWLHDKKGMTLGDAFDSFLLYHGFGEYAAIRLFGA